MTNNLSSYITRGILLVEYRVIGLTADCIGKRSYCPCTAASLFRRGTGTGNAQYRGVRSLCLAHASYTNLCRSIVVLVSEHNILEISERISSREGDAAAKKRERKRGRAAPKTMQVGGRRVRNCVARIIVGPSHHSIPPPPRRPRRPHRCHRPPIYEHPVDVR